MADIGLDTSTASAQLVERSDVAAWLPARPADAHKWRAARVGRGRLDRHARRRPSGLPRRAAGRGRHGAAVVARRGQRPAGARPRWSAGRCRRRCGLQDVLADLEPLPRPRRSGRASDAPMPPPRVPATSSPVRRCRSWSTATACSRWPGRPTVPGRSCAARPAATVLTPHDGEFRLLCGAAPGPDRIAAARHLADRAAVRRAAEGPGDRRGRSRGHAYLVDAGDARLATAGTGDVLSGIIGALLAQHVPPSRRRRPARGCTARPPATASARGLVAGDLPDLIPAVLAEL